MADDLAASVAKLRNSAAQLNEITDQANETVKGVENFLNHECSVGVPAYANVSSSPLCDQHGEELGHAYTALSYQEYAGRYRIVIAKGTDLDPEDETAKPWSDSSREDKLDTFEKLPDLIAAIAKKLDEKVVAARATAATVARVLGALTSKGGK